MYNVYNPSPQDLEDAITLKFEEEERYEKEYCKQLEKNYWEYIKNEYYRQNS